MIANYSTGARYALAFRYVKPSEVNLVCFYDSFDVQKFRVCFGRCDDCNIIGTRAARGGFDQEVHSRGRGNDWILGCERSLKVVLGHLLVVWVNMYSGGLGQ